MGKRPKKDYLELKEDGIEEIIEDSMTILREFLDKYDNLSKLQIRNSMMFDGDIAQNWKSFSGSLIGSGIALSDSEYEYFLYRMRLTFMKYNAIFLNTLTTPAVYANFLGKTEMNVRQMIRRGRLDVVTISGRSFVMPFDWQVMDFNKFLMKAGFTTTCAPSSVDGVVEVWDSVELWVKAAGMNIDGDRRYKAKMFTADAYEEYKVWCKQNVFDIETLYVFSSRMAKMGFRKFANGKRGFYVWHNVYRNKPNDGREVWDEAKWKEEITKNDEEE